MPDNTLKRNNFFFRQLIFLGVLFFLGAVIFKQLGFFIGSFLGALTMYIVLRNIMFTLTEHYKWRRWITSLMLVMAMTVVLLGFGFLVFEITASKITDLDASGVVESINGLGDKLSAKLGFKLGADNIFNQLSTIITKAISEVVNTTYSFAINVFLTLVILYFMLVNGRKMEAKAYEYVPFKGKSLEMVRSEVKNMIFSNAVGIPLVMFTQGITAYLIFWALGIDNPIFWAFLTALCGLIPMIGTALVTVPMGAYMIAHGHIAGGIILIICGLFIIANVDNVCRIILLKKTANTHPLVVIFGVILGIPLFGFWGIIFGPLFISGFLLLTKIYYHEYRLLEKDKTADCPEEPETVPSDTTSKEVNTTDINVKH